MYYLIAAEATSTFSTLITHITDFVTAAIGWVSDVVETVTATGNELLLIVFVMGLAGFAVGLFKRLVRF